MKTPSWKWHSNLWRVEFRCEAKEVIFGARDRETSHWMIVSELFFNQVQQILENRMVKVKYRHHKSSMHLTNINWEMAFRNIIARRIDKRVVIILTLKIRSKI